MSIHDLAELLHAVTNGYNEKLKFYETRIMGNGHARRTCHSPQLPTPHTVHGIVSSICVTVGWAHCKAYSPISGVISVRPSFATGASWLLPKCLFVKRVWIVKIHCYLLLWDSHLSVLLERLPRITMRKYWDMFCGRSWKASMWKLCLVTKRRSDCRNWETC